MTALHDNPRKPKSLRRRCVLSGKWLAWTLLLMGTLTTVALMRKLFVGIETRGGRRSINLRWVNGDGDRDLVEDNMSSVLEDDAVHLVALHESCMKFKSSVIPWHVGLGTVDHRSKLVNESNDNVLERLSECPDVDIFIPEGIRNHGYCEDAVAFTKFLRSRMLPRWAFENEWFDERKQRKVSYHELCPNTPVVFFNHYFDGINEHPKWPRNKKMMVMPNIEMYEVDSKIYKKADFVLCKTRICEEYVNKWYHDYGNPRGTIVMYTHFTTSDIATSARQTLGSGRIAAKNFTHPTFLHTPGTSMQKGTRSILNCWLKRPDLPRLDIYMGQGLLNDHFSDLKKRAKESSNIRFHVGITDAVTFGQIQAEASIFLCTSLMEGYGHYINQARAAGGLVLTTNVPPMNELITDATGVLVAAEKWAHHQQFLGGDSKLPDGLRNVEGYVARFGPKQVCEAVDQVLQMTADERARRATRARQQYLDDTLEFARQMQRLRVLARG